MPNIELLEKSMPVAPIRIAALAGCRELAEEVDKKLVKFRKELVAAKKSTIIPHQRIRSWYRPLHYGRCDQLQPYLQRMRPREPHVSGRSLPGSEENHLRSHR